MPQIISQNLRRPSQTVHFVGHPVFERTCSWYHMCIQDRTGLKLIGTSSVFEPTWIRTDLFQLSSHTDEFSVLQIKIKMKIGLIFKYFKRIIRNDRLYKLSQEETSENMNKS